MDNKMFEVALGIEKPLYIKETRFEQAAGELHIEIDFKKGSRFNCSECGEVDCKVHDTEQKTWQHLHFWQYKTFLHLRTPRTKCDKCGSRIWVPPWGRKSSGFTLLFEAFTVALAKEMPISKVAEIMGEWDTRIWRIVRGSVRKAFKIKDFSRVTRITIDETSSRKGHRYVTIVTDIARALVIFATKGRKKETIKEFAEFLPEHNAVAQQIQEVSIDMSPAFISGVKNHLENAQITFDKFHVIQEANKKVDAVRREELAVNPLLKKTRWLWLKNPSKLTETEKKQLKTVSKEKTKTARAYQMKLTLQDIYREAKTPKIADELLKKWLSWAMRSRLEPMKQLAKTIKNHYSGILRYFESGITSGIAEGMNSKIQEVKRRAKGFRNIDNFITMIYLECAGLDLPT